MSNVQQDTQLIIDNINEEIARVEEKKAELVKELYPRFKDIFKPFFEKCPEVVCIAWQQFTPFFNDGEPCEFTVYDIHGYLEGEEVTGWEGTFPSNVDWYEEKAREGDDYGVKRLAELAQEVGDLTRHKEISKEFNEATKFITQLPDDILEALFGDHVTVIITPEGVEVNEYEDHH